MLDIPNINDATSFYRGVGPLSALRLTESRVAYEAFMDFSWATCSMTDALFMQRPFNEKHRTKFGVYKLNMRKPVWVDYDDDLFNVPEDNPTYKYYNNTQNRKTLQGILEKADFVTVSTEHLAEQYRKFNKNITVVRNALNTHLLGMFDKRLPRNKYMMWRGSETHHRDLLDFAPEIVEVQNSDAAKEWAFQYIGMNPWYITNNTPHARTFYSEAMDPFIYHDTIYNLAPTCLFVPLHDNVFNRSKSNIAWIEATLAGAICIAPDWEEWRNPGCLNYKNKNEFKELMYAVIRGEINVDQKHQESRKSVYRDYDVMVTNKKRRAVISDLLNVHEKLLFED